MGNLLSVQKALEYLGEDVRIISAPKNLQNAERLVLPGVGAFPDAMANLERHGWQDALHVEVFEKKKPFLGICLGMQLLAEFGEENGGSRGLGWIKGTVKLFTLADRSLKIPHVGWNEIIAVPNSPLFNGIRPGATFYFVHSYHFVCTEQHDVAVRCQYGSEFTAAIRKENIFATQFHPEKSQDNGLKVLENFVDWKL